MRTYTIIFLYFALINLKVFPRKTEYNISGIPPKVEEKKHILVKPIQNLENNMCIDNILKDIENASQRYEDSTKKGNDIPFQRELDREGVSKILENKDKIPIDFLIYEYMNKGSVEIFTGNIPYGTGELIFVKTTSETHIRVNKGYKYQNGYELEGKYYCISYNRKYTTTKGHFFLVILFSCDKEG